MPHRTLGIICSSEGWGGLELNTLRLARWLRDEGWKVHLLTSGGAAIAANDEGACNSVTAFAESGKPARAGQLRVVHRWVQRFKIRVLLVPFNKDIAVASLYKRFYNEDIGLVYQQHMQVGVRKRDFIHTLRYAMIDMWISPLQYLKEETLRLTRVKSERIKVIPFGIELHPFLESGVTKATAREALSLPQDATIIGVLGRLDPKKGQDLAINGLRQLRAQGKSSFHLLLMGALTIGEGDAYSQSLYRLVQELALEEWVHFRPYTEDVIRFYRAIDVFVMPSHGETFGMVTIEAMAACVPVIGTNKDGTREILGEGKYGNLFEKDDVDGFCKAVLQAQQDNQLPQKLKAAQDMVCRTFSKEQMMGELIPLLNNLTVEGQ